MAMKPVLSDEYVKELSTVTGGSAIMMLVFGLIAMGAGVYLDFADKVHDSNFFIMGLAFIAWSSLLAARMRTLQENAEIYRAIKSRD